MIETIGQIHQTSDYSIFKFREDNRSIGQNLKLKKELKENGILAPIMVNEEYEVIDGQHRLSIAMENNLKVPFIVIKGAGKKEIISLNTTNKVWGLQDYINSFDSQGYSEYRQLNELIKKYNIPVSTLISISLGFSGSTGSAGRMVKDGDFRFKDIFYTIKFLNFHKRFEEKSKQKSSFTLIDALYMIYHVQKLDEERILDKVYTIIDETQGITHRSIIARIILNIYNKNFKEGSQNEIQYFIDRRGNILIQAPMKPESF